MNNRLFDYRMSLKYKFQKDFADYLGINRKSYCEYENNSRQPNIDTVIQILMKLNISFEELYGLTSFKPATIQSQQLDIKPQIQIEKKSETKEEKPKKKRITNLVIGGN